MSSPPYGWILAAAIAAFGSACAAEPGNADVVDLRDPRINTSVYECKRPDGAVFEFTIRQGPGEMAAWLPWEFGYPYLVLSLDSAEDAPTYREGEVAVRIDERGAGLTVGEQRYTACSRNDLRSAWEHAKLTGVDFRAAGADPDWVLEIRNGDTMTFRADDARTAVQVPTPAPRTDAVERMSVFDASDPAQLFEVHISGTQCVAPDRGDVMGASVTVILNERSYTGCGRALH